VAGREHDLTVLSLQEDRTSPVAAALEKHGARVQYLPGKNLVDPGRFRQMLSFVRRGQYDIVHTHLTFSNILGTTAAFLSRTPAVATLHNERIHRRRFFAIKFGVETLLLRHVSKEVIAVGYSAEQAHRRRLEGKVIRIIPNAMEMPKSISLEERQALRTTLAGDASRPLVITVGRLTQQKGYADLLTAFALVTHRFPQAKLLIVGAGVLREALQAQIASLGLQWQAELLGLRSDVPGLLAAADIYVNSSLWEGLSEALLEGMAAGLPVVATSVGDAPRVVIPGAGALTPPGAPEGLANELCALLGDPEKARASGEIARQYVLRCHNPQDWAEKILELYRASTPDRPQFQVQRGQA
jgi:glycosyltransferase involved in cell wall biosynthesis